MLRKFYEKVVVPTVMYGSEPLGYESNGETETKCV